jgi:hypothetical protein
MKHMFDHEVSSNPSLFYLGYAFGTLQWNLLARSSTVAAIMLSHIDWSGDALVINIPRHKGDVHGLHCHPRHLFADPEHPWRCPVTALAVLVFTRSYPMHTMVDGVKYDITNWTLFHQMSKNGKSACVS